MGSMSLGGALLGAQSLPPHLQCALVPEIREGVPTCARGHLTTRLCRDSVSSCLCDVQGLGVPQQCPVSPQGLLSPERTRTPLSDGMFLKAGLSPPAEVL